MNRRGFLGLIGCGAGAVVLGPLLPATDWKFVSGTYGGAAGGGKTNAYYADFLHHFSFEVTPVHKDDYIFFANDA